LKINIPNEQEVRQAVQDSLKHFWNVRKEGVLHGRTMQAFEEIIKKFLVQNGVLEEHITSGRKATVPGFYRASKKWDILVHKPLENGKNLLLAAIELKSMFGSVGNNLNNRSEEAVGSAYDLKQANIRLHLSGNDDVFGRPFMGYIFVLGEHEDNKKGSRITIPLFEADDVFIAQDEGKNISESYETRAEVLVKRLVESELYTSGAFIIANAKDYKLYTEPSQELGFYQFIAKLLGDVISRYHVAR